MKLFTLRQIPFNRFQEFLIDRDLTAIGEGEEIDLLEHATNIQNDFIDAIGADDNTARLNVECQISVYEAKLAITQALVDMLAVQYDERLVNELIEEGYSGRFTEETIIDDLKGVVAQSKQYVLMKDDLQKSLDELGEGSKPATYEYYSSVLNAISRMEKREISDDINTQRFCDYFKRLLTQLDKEDGRREAQ